MHTHKYVVNKPVLYQALNVNINNIVNSALSNVVLKQKYRHNARNLCYGGYLNCLVFKLIV